MEAHMDEQEQAFIEAFIDPARRQRYLLHLASSRNRRRVLERLNHRLDLRAGVAAELSADLTPAGLVAELKQRGATTKCHVIADSSERDGQELSLVDGVDFALAHPFGVVLCCLPGRLACYKPESPGAVLLLERVPADSAAMPP
jgi:hypothetical protein